MPSLATNRRSLFLRLAAIIVLVINGIAWTPERDAEPVRGLIREAEDLAYFEAFVPAMAKLETALRAAERLGDANLMATCLDQIGSVLDFEGQADAGAAQHQRALKLAHDIDDRRLAASIRASIGLAHWRRSQYDAALSSLHEALAVQQELGDDVGRARTLAFIGRVHFKKAEYTEAKETYRRAVAVLETTGDHRWQSITLEDLGDLALEQGFYAEALTGYEQALEARRAIGDKAGEVYVLHVIGRAYLRQGAHREALAWFERASALARQDRNRSGLALALYHAGIAHSALAHPIDALKSYSEALTLKEELGDRRQQAWILMHMGDVRAGQHDFPSALERYGRATRIWEEIRDPRGVATGLEKAARADFELGRYEDALDLFRRAGEIVASSQPASLASTVSGMGKTYAAAGDEPRALEHGRRAALLARQVGNDEMRWQTARSLGWIERRLGHRDDALISYRESLAIIETLRGRLVASGDVRAGFLEGKQAVYGETVELLFELGRFEEALEVAERARARAFLDLLSGRELVTNTASFVTAPPLTLQQTRQEARRGGATTIEYFSGNDRLFIWVLPPDGAIRATSSQISRRELSELVAAVRGSLRADGGDPRPVLRRLHQLLIEPVSDSLPRERDRVLTIIPHGPLFLVSFAALVGRDGGYFVEHHTLAYSPSIAVLRYTGRNRDRVVNAAAPRLLVVGNPAMPKPPDGHQPLVPLPGAENEARAIGGLYPAARVSALIGSFARERTVRELAPRQTIIHLATHAVVFDDEPMGSYLALGPEAGSDSGPRDPLGDGLLSVAEVFGLDLHADLVTLSACNTGLGRVNGEGVVGLSRAFIYAGTASVVVSLWRVADTVATPLMERFYRRLIRTGGDKAAALAAAQRETIALLREGKLESPSGRTLAEDPLLWAPFVLVGEAR
jgi:CHAT domain-containing protein